MCVCVCDKLTTCVSLPSSKCWSDHWTQATDTLNHCTISLVILSLYRGVKMKKKKKKTLGQGPNIYLPP